MAIPFLEIPVPESATGLLGEGAADAAANVGNTALQLAGNPALLVGGIILVVAAIVLFFFIKKIIINSVLGIAAWLVLMFIFHVELPFIPSLAVSVIFGLAGIGAMLVLRFFGIL